jgi:hypothetical protein
MLLCLLLSDRSFVQHSESNYFSSFLAKTGALKTVEKIVSVYLLWTGSSISLPLRCCWAMLDRRAIPREDVSLLLLT